MRNNNLKARVIAFYLPQFHPIPENNKWWGKGFTEWTNVGKAKPFFEGHNQPKLPADLGYYDLRVKETKLEQIKLAKEYGIEAFCYWHYWFAGKQLLERPFQEVVKDKEIDFPFCLGWANQTWSGIWHGAPDKILIEQTYPGLEDYKNHFYSLLEAFKDERYMRIDGKLVFLIYNPKNLPDAKEFTQYWQELAIKEELQGFYFIAHLTNESKKYGCDACVEGAPFVTMNARAMNVNYLDSGAQPKVYDYNDLVKYSINYQLNVDENEFPLVMPNWDNTPRSKENGIVLQDSSPQKFAEIMQSAIEKVKRTYNAENQIIFIKAWNEWAEGNYLEPDSEFGLQYLEALRESLITVPYEKPWTNEYYTYRSKVNQSIYQDHSTLNKFRKSQKLDNFFALGLDERSIEIPWILSVLNTKEKNILDAGSALNHKDILNHTIWKDKQLTITTIALNEPKHPFDWVNYVYSDLRDLPFKDNTYDAVVSISTLEHIGMDNSLFNDDIKYKEDNELDYIKALKEMYRVLKPGGKLYLTVPFGQYINYIEFQQFNKQMIDTSAKYFNQDSRQETYYYYDYGWKLAESYKQCENAIYSQYGILSCWGSKNIETSPDKDGAVAARAVVCCIWEKSI